MSARLPHEDDEWPVYLDGRGIAIQEGDTVVYAARAISTSAEIVEGIVSGFTNKGKVIVSVVRRLHEDRYVTGLETSNNYKPIHVAATALAVATLPKSLYPTRRERIEAKQEEISKRQGIRNWTPS